MQTIDVMTPEGRVAFYKLAKEQETFRDAVGLGHKSAADLLSDLASFLCRVHSDDNGESFQFDGDLASAEVLRRHAGDSLVWQSDRQVRAIITRMAKPGTVTRKGHPAAKELLNRINGRLSECNAIAAVRHFRIRQEEAEAKGNKTLAAIFRNLADRPEAAVEYLAPLIDGKPIKRQVLNAKTAAAQDRLDRFERATAGLRTKEREAILEAFAEADGVPAKRMQDKLTRAAIRRNELARIE